MRSKPPKHLEMGRIKTGLLASSEGYGMNGAFIIATPNGGRLMLILSDCGGWDHVSVEWRSADDFGDGITSGHCPTWDEMHYVRRVCFEPDEWVVQYMPPPIENINVNPNVLHLWRPQGVEIPKPPRNFI